MNKINQLNNEEFDAEWITLIMSARKMGMTMDDIRAFLKNPFQHTKFGQNPAENKPCVTT
ncbi:Anti-repressor SinI [compost metagenome]